MSDNILTLNEYQDLDDAMTIADEIITDEIYDQVAYYLMELDEETFDTIVKLFDDQDLEITQLVFSDYELAVEVMQDLFDIDEEDFEEEYYD